MKTYIQGIIIGILSILSGLLISGIPFGTEIFEIANAAVLIAGVVVVLLLGVFKKKYTASLIASSVYLVLLTVLTAIIETGMSGFVIVGVGFVPGLSLAITGLVTSLQQKGRRKTLAATIISVIGILLNIASLVMAVMNGFIVG